MLNRVMGIGLPLTMNLSSVKEAAVHESSWCVDGLKKRHGRKNI